MIGSFLKKQSFFLFLMTMLLMLPWAKPALAEGFDRNQYIYDNAHLLTAEENAELQNLAAQLGEEWETAFIIITINGTDGKPLVQYVEDFYDDNAPGYDQPHGNTAILAIDMKERDIYLAGFKKAEQYLDDSRLNQIRDMITPDLSSGQYYQAFTGFLNESAQSMSIEPSGNSGGGYSDSGSGGSENYYNNPDSYNGHKAGMNPENIFFQWWFQLIASVIVALIVVSVMVFRSGGRVTVNARTYMDEGHSGILNKYDHFVRQTVTKVRKPSNNTRSGGGGGVSGGGHSHSGSSGKF